jgi:hypothetical protein
VKITTGSGDKWIGTVPVKEHVKQVIKTGGIALLKII